MDEIHGITIEFKGNTVNLDKSVSNLNNMMKALKTESMNLNKALKLDPSNVDKINQSIKNLSNQHKILNEQINLYTKELNNVDSGSEEFINLSKKIDKATYSLDRVAEKLNKLNSWKSEYLNQQFTKLGKSIESIGDKISSVGEILTLFSTIAAGGLGFAAKEAISFEQAFTGVAKTVDATDKQLETLRQGIIDMSKEIPATTTEISAVAEAAGQLGIKTDDILEFTKTMIGLSNSTNLTSDEAATMIAQFANVVDINGEYEKFASALVELGNNGASTEREIMELAQRLSGAGSVANMSAQEILGLAASMANVGINAESGGTAMSTLISMMEKASLNGGVALDNLARVAQISAEEFVKAWENEPSVAIDMFLNGLNEIQASGGNVYDTLTSLGISEKRLTDVILRLSSETGKVAENTNMANDAWGENAALATELERFYGNIASQLVIVGNKLKAVALQFGDRLMPLIQTFINYTSNLIDKFAALDEQTQNMILAITGLVVALGPVLLIVGKATTSFGKLFEFMGNHKVISNMSSSFGKLKGVLGSVGGVFGQVGKNLDNIFNLSGVFATISTSLSGFFTTIFTNLSTFLTTLLTPITTFLTTIWGNISGLFTNIIATIMNNPIVAAITSKLSMIAQAFTPLTNALSAIQIPFGAFAAVLALAYAASEDFRTAVNNLVGSIISGLKPILDTIISTFSLLWEKLQNELWPVFTMIGDFLAAYIIPILQSIWDWIATYIVPIIQGLVGLLGGVFSTTLTIVIEAVKVVVNLLKDVFDGIKKVWDWLDDLGVWDAFGAALGTIAKLIGDCVSWLQSFFEWCEKAARAVGDFLSAAGDIIGNVWDGVTGWVGDLLSSGGDGSTQSGGFASGGTINLTTHINVNTNQPVTDEDTRRWAYSMVDVINEELGVLL